MPRQSRDAPKPKEQRLHPKTYAKLKDSRISGLGVGDTALVLEFLPAEEAADILASLLPRAGFEPSLDDEIQWQRMDYYGIPVPRLVCVQGERGQDGSMPIYRHPVDEPPQLFELTPTVRKVIEAARATFAVPFNHALIQLYRSGGDSINVHSDKTLDIAHGTPIVNVSFGASREFVVRSKEKMSCASWPQLRQNIVLPHNSALAFGLETNRRCTHQIMPDRRPDGQRRGDETAFGGVRVSLTLRVVATFQRPDGRLYGQGAKCKTSEEASKTGGVDGELEEGTRMAEAFRRENVDPNFDWAGHYGRGFDLLAPNYTQPPRKVVNAGDVPLKHPKTLAAAAA
mmetsp:Transcript_36994/g.68965  ORF Transcript_36994/g.68965 Transcript_36994/m.68965 type:complete len:342 (-) Transcript_36994:242-1267(-)